MWRQQGQTHYICPAHTGLLKILCPKAEEINTETSHSKKNKKKENIYILMSHLILYQIQRTSLANDEWYTAISVGSPRKSKQLRFFLPNFFLTRIEKHQSWFSYFNIKPTRPFKAKRLTGFKFPSLSCTSRTKYSHEFLPFHPMRIELCAYLFTFWNTTEHGEAILLLCRTDFAELWWFFWPTVYTILHCACHWKTLHTVSL